MDRDVAGRLLVAVLCLCPVAVLGAAGVVLLLGGPAWGAVLVGLTAPSALAAVLVLGLVAAVRRRRPGAVSPDPEPDVEPARPRALDLVHREVDLRATGGELLQAAAGTPSPEVEQLRGLAERLRTARLQPGGPVRSEPDLRRRLPLSRPEVSDDELRKGLGEAP